MADLDASTVEALNALLEDERASVEMEIAFANGTTELNEREAFVTMGSAEVGACCALRDILASQRVDVSRRINGIVLRVLSIDRYDDRLRAFAEHQLGVCESIEPLLDATTHDTEAHRLLEDIYESHARYGQWCERRAEEFANSRLLDFRSGRGDGAGTAQVQPNAPGSDPLTHNVAAISSEASDPERPETSDAPYDSPQAQDGRDATSQDSKRSIDTDVE